MEVFKLPCTRAIVGEKEGYNVSITKYFIGEEAEHYIPYSKYLITKANTPLKVMRLVALTEVAIFK
jgi:hypothetical protein